MGKKIAFLVLSSIIVLACLAALYKAATVIAASRAGTKPAAPASPAAESKPAAAPDDDALIKGAEETIARDPSSAKAEDAYWRIASVYERRRDLLNARDAYRKIIDNFPSSNNITRAQEALQNKNMEILFSDAETPDSFVYEVQKGDNLFNIAKKYGTTVELLSKANSLKGGVLRYGKRLKISKLKFSIAVDKSQNILTLKADGNLFKTYRVSTGKDSSTPIGVFKITSKIVDPPWYPPSGKVIPAGDPKNVLGSRWLGISKPSYGIHGTIDPSSIGKSVTEGCVRMKNEEVEELYSIVPEGTEVVIVD